VITGVVETDAIRAGKLVIEPGGVLTQHFTPSSAAPESLTIEVTELVVKAGGAIDVSSRGYANNVTYPGHAVPLGDNGGSHLGEGTDVVRQAGHALNAEAFFQMFENVAAHLGNG